MCVFFSLQKMSAGFPARHEKARITKDLHICQRFGGRGGGGGGARFITFSKVQKLNIGPFWRALPKFSTESRRVLTALRRRPLVRSALGYRRRQRGDGGGGTTRGPLRRSGASDVTIGQLHRGRGGHVGSGSNQRPFLRSPVPRLAKKQHGHEGASEALSVLNSVCTGRSLI